MTVETSSLTTSPTDVAEALGATLGAALPGPATVLATGAGVPTGVPANAAALRVVLAGATRTTVVVAVWEPGDGSPASDPADLVPVLGPALLAVGLPDDGEVDVVPAAAALAEVDATAGHVLLGAADLPFACVVVQLPAGPVADATTAPAAGRAVPAQRPTPPAAGVGITAGAVAAPRLELLRGVELAVTAELGRTRMSLRELLSLTPGTVVELDRAAGSPVDLLVNGTLLARGEVVVVDEEFGVRITELVHSEEPGESLR